MDFLCTFLSALSVFCSFHPSFQQSCPILSTQGEEVEGTIAVLEDSKEMQPSEAEMPFPNALKEGANPSHFGQAEEPASLPQEHTVRILHTQWNLSRVFLC